MDNNPVSPGGLRMLGSAAAEVSFETSSGLLWDLAGLRIDPKQVQRFAERLGQEMADDERQDTTPFAHGDLPPTMYLGIDGSGIPVRPEELIGRAGKQADGKAKTREGKLAIVWSAESRDEQGLPMRDPGSITYSAAIESAATFDTDECPSEFAARVQREAARRRFTKAQRTVATSSGRSRCSVPLSALDKGVMTRCRVRPIACSRPSRRSGDRSTNEIVLGATQLDDLQALVGSAIAVSEVVTLGDRPRHLGALRETQR